MRKAARASALTLLLTLSTTPTILSNTSRDATPPGAALGYAPVATDFIYPVGNPRIAPTFDQDNANGYQITQMFNNSCDPAQGQGYYYAGQYFCGHTGVDLSDRSEGGSVVATANGVVVFAGYNSTYGEMVRIQHLLPDGTYIYSQYEHLQYGGVFASYGQVVTLGQQIGLVGSTGFVTGAHLHFEIKSVNEDGVGYTFGNAALIYGYYDPISYVAAHTRYLEPTATATPPPPTATAQAAPDSAATPAAGSAAPRAISATIPTTQSTTASNGGEHKAVLADFYSRYHDYVTVTADHLNVRTGSGFDFAPINSVKRGAKLAYLGLTGNGWVHVALPSNVYGYVARQWITGSVLPPLPSSQWGDLKPPFATVLDDLYPARTGPRMRSPALEPLWQGEKVTYLGTLGSWDRVVLPSGRIGWVLNWYLREPSVHYALSPAVAPATAAKPAAVKPATSSGSAGGGTAPAPTNGQAAGQPAAAHHDGTAVAGSRDGTAQAAVAGAYVVTTVDGLRLRSGPRLAAGIIEELALGTKLRLRGYHTSWVAVIAPDGAVGYVLGSYVKTLGAVSPATVATASSRAPATTAPRAAAPRAPGTAASGQQAAPGFASPFVSVNVDGANLRAGPSLKAAVLVSEPDGTVLALRGGRGVWDYVETRRGLVGWMRSDLVRPVAAS